MKSFSLSLSLTAVLLASFALGLPSFAQDSSASNTAAKSAATPSQAVLEAWNDIGRKLVAMAEDFPESKYDFKPNPAQRSFAEQLLHAATGAYYFTGPASGKPAPTADAKREQYKTKAAVVDYLKKSIADGAAVIKAKGDQGMNDVVVDPDSKRPFRILDLAYGLIEHSGEHYGQLVVYYRVAGMVPPESRPKK